MHSLYFAILGRRHAKSSKQARYYASQRLRELGFVDNEDHLFGSGKCDWFVIGGRWSGELQIIQLGGWKEFYRLRSTGNAKDTPQDIQNTWGKMGGKYNCPISRDRYNKLGYSDDAIVLTMKRVELLKNTRSDVQYVDFDHGCEREMLDLSSEDVGRWCVVIDYHC